MKYCIQYDKNFRYNDIIDEVIFHYDDYKDNLLNEIGKQKWKTNQRIIVHIGNYVSDYIPLLRKIMKDYNNFAVLLTSPYEKEKELKEYNIPFFYDTYADTADEVYGLIKRGVSDIYITESLAFNIAEVGQYCKNKGVNVRVIPNIAQYKIGFKNQIPDPYKFFVRPEDVEIYEPFVDVFEIISPLNRQSIIYEIYKNGQWMGDLGQLIVGFDEPFYNSGLVPFFGPERLKCRQKCMQEKCNLCQQMKELSDSFYKNNLEIKKPIDKEWKNETKSHKKIVQFVKETASDIDTKISKE